MEHGFGILDSTLSAAKTTFGSVRPSPLRLGGTAFAAAVMGGNQLGFNPCGHCCVGAFCTDIRCHFICQPDADQALRLADTSRNKSLSSWLNLLNWEIGLQRRFFTRTSVNVSLSSWMVGAVTCSASATKSGGREDLAQGLWWRAWFMLYYSLFRALFTNYLHTHVFLSL
jgi:hypothetical protein